jgi:hypothetical protein
MENGLSRRYSHVTSLDFSNAFSREISHEACATGAPRCTLWDQWAYGARINLVIKDPSLPYRTLSSAQGIRQGDPLGPLFFSLAVRRSLEAFAASLGPDHLMLAYLDDIYILGPDDSALSATQVVFHSSSSLTLNAGKSRCYPLADVRLRGLPILGSCIGPTEARHEFLQSKVDRLVPQLDQLGKLPRQHALLCLRLSLQQRLRHLLRTLPSSDILATWQTLDEIIWNDFRRIRGGPTLPAELCQRDDTLISLPVRYGG